MRIISIMPMNNKYYKDNYAISNNTNYTSKVSGAAQVNFGSRLPDNFGTVIEEKLFRGSFPHTRENFLALKEKGVKFIMNLCGLTDEEIKLAKEFEMELIHVDGEDFATNKEKLSHAIKIIEDKMALNEVGYIHCDKGQTKTGLLIAGYQLKHLEELKMLPENVREHYLKYGGNAANFFLFGYSHFSDAPFLSIFEY